MWRFYMLKFAPCRAILIGVHYNLITYFQFSSKKFPTYFAFDGFLVWTYSISGSSAHSCLHSSGFLAPSALFFSIKAPRYHKAPRFLRLLGPRYVCIGVLRLEWFMHIDLIFAQGFARGAGGTRFVGMEQCLIFSCRNCWPTFAPLLSKIIPWMWWHC